MLKYPRGGSDLMTSGVRPYPEPARMILTCITRVPEQVANPFDGAFSQLCPPQHTCDTQVGGFLGPRGERTRGTEITVEANTPYVDLGAIAMDNLKPTKSLTKSIVRKEVGPLRTFLEVERVYPVYPDFYLINMAVTPPIQKQSTRIVRLTDWNRLQGV